MRAHNTTICIPLISRCGHLRACPPLISKCGHYLPLLNLNPPFPPHFLTLLSLHDDAPRTGNKGKGCDHGAVSIKGPVFTAWSPSETRCDDDHVLQTAACAPDLQTMRWSFRPTTLQSLGSGSGSGSGINGSGDPEWRQARVVFVRVRVLVINDGMAPDDDAAKSHFSTYMRCALCEMLYLSLLCNMRDVTQRVLVPTVCLLSARDHTLMLTMLPLLSLRAHVSFLHLPTPLLRLGS